MTRSVIEMRDTSANGNKVGCSFPYITDFQGDVIATGVRASVQAIDGLTYQIHTIRIV